MPGGRRDAIMDDLIAELNVLKDRLQALLVRL